MSNIAELTLDLGDLGEHDARVEIDSEETWPHGDLEPVLGSVEIRAVRMRPKEVYWIDVTDLIGEKQEKEILKQAIEWIRGI